MADPTSSPTPNADAGTSASSPDAAGATAAAHAWSSRRLITEAGLVFAALLCAHALLVTLERWPIVRGSWDFWHTAAFLYIPLVPILASSHDLAAFGLTLGDGGARGAASCVAKAALLTLIPFLVVWGGATATIDRAGTTAVGLGSSVTSELVRLLADHRMRWAPAPNVASLVWYHLVAVAIPEEFFFRTYLQSRLDQAWGTPWRVAGAPLGWGLIVSSMAFALTHPAFGRDWTSLDVFFPSLVFGWLRARSGSLAAPVAFHWLCNVTVLNLGG